MRVRREIQSCKCPYDSSRLAVLSLHRVHRMNSPFVSSKTFHSLSISLSDFLSPIPTHFPTQFPGQFLHSTRQNSRSENASFSLPLNGSSPFLTEITYSSPSVPHSLSLRFFFSSSGSFSPSFDHPLRFSFSIEWVSLFLLQEGRTCIVNRNCDAGLHCETCFADGNVRPRCTRIQPISPISKV